MRTPNGGVIFKYRIHSPDGDDLEEPTYAMMIRSGEEDHLAASRRFRVIDVVTFDEEYSRRSAGLLRVPPA